MLLWVSEEATITESPTPLAGLAEMDASHTFSANADHEFYSKRLMEDAKLLFIKDGPSMLELVYQAEGAVGSIPIRNSIYNLAFADSSATRAQEVQNI